jgi:hypothetical protein
MEYTLCPYIVNIWTMVLAQIQIRVVDLTITILVYTLHPPEKHRFRLCIVMYTQSSILVSCRRFHTRMEQQYSPRIDIWHLHYIPKWCGNFYNYMVPSKHPRKHGQMGKASTQECKPKQKAIISLL